MLNTGMATRTVRSTRINEYSSRSHALFILEISQSFPNGISKRGKLNLVDLAGSEKVPFDKLDLIVLAGIQKRSSGRFLGGSQENQFIAFLLGKCDPFSHDSFRPYSLSRLKTHSNPARVSWRKLQDLIDNHVFSLFTSDGGDNFYSEVCNQSKIH